MAAPAPTALRRPGYPGPDGAPPPDLGGPGPGPTGPGPQAGGPDRDYGAPAPANGAVRRHCAKFRYDIDGNRVCAKQGG